MLRIFTLFVIAFVVAPVAAQTPSVPAPTGLQFMQGRIAEDSATIASLLDQIGAARAQNIKLSEDIAALQAQLAKRSVENSSPAHGK